MSVEVFLMDVCVVIFILVYDIRYNSELACILVIDFRKANHTLLTFCLSHHAALQNSIEILSYLPLDTCMYVHVLLLMSLFYIV